MNLRRISALLALLVFMSAANAQTAPPNAPVSDPPPATDPASKTDSDPNAQPTKPTADPAKPAPANPVAAPKGAKTADGDFKPSEDISEDMSVAYPVDI